MSQTPTESPLDGADFENEVRRIARALWPPAEMQGSDVIGGRERDGIFSTDDQIHVIEATISRARDKARDDANKINTLVHKLRKQNRDKAVKGWLVTQSEPTADQRKVVNGIGEAVTLVSYDQFRSRIVNAREYLELRTHYAFGSVRDPETGGIADSTHYVAMDMLSPASKESLTIGELTSKLLDGERVVLLGDYGAGKSMTIRELFKRLRALNLKGRIYTFPIALNLRDHFGQDDPAEALHRHAVRVGFANPSHLVRAWRLGQCQILLDGFDELGASRWQGDVKQFPTIRQRAMGLVRRFITETSRPGGMLIAGRAHYFDSDRELRRALGAEHGFATVTLEDFTDAQVKAFLERKGWKESIPTWLPSRPLLLGYLAARGLLQQVLEVEAGSSPAAGWDALFDRLCTREAEITQGIDGTTIRRLLEKLATHARRYMDGRGPLMPTDMVATFEGVCGYAPDERGMILLQRLPGLSVSSAEDQAREFVDIDYVDVARAGDVVRFGMSPFGGDINLDVPWQASLGDLGTDVVALRLQRDGASAKQLSAAIQAAAPQEGGAVLASELVAVLARTGQSFVGDPTALRHAFLPQMRVEESAGDLSEVSFEECLLAELEVDASCPAEKMPRFRMCDIGMVRGRTSVDDLPQGVFDTRCTFSEFEEGAATATEILQSSLPLGVRVALTMLKKLYVQAGHGRRESALMRGLDHRGRAIAGKVVELIRKSGLAMKSRAGDVTIWLPIRDERKRVLAMLRAPTSTPDLLLREASALV